MYKELAKELISGSYDLHTHTIPSAFPRALDDLELVREAEDVHMAGVMIKAHWLHGGTRRSHQPSQRLSRPRFWRAGAQLAYRRIKPLFC